MMHNMWRSEGIFWTYNLSWRVGENFILNPSDSYNAKRDTYASYGGATGHGTATYLGIDENSALLYWGWRLNDPVLAWHYYANPSGLYEDIPDGDLLADWNTPRDSYKSFLQFLAWGEVKPKSPKAAGWPLDALWKHIGIGIMRLSWAKNPSVIISQGFSSDPNLPTGKVWMQCGQAGSKIRASQGAVLFDADNHDVLRAGPYNGSSGSDSQFLQFDPHTQNTLFIDDEGQFSTNILPDLRQRHGSIEMIATDTYLMDASSRPNGNGWHDLWDAKSYGVKWTREVHLHRDADINKVVLWIHDQASTYDRNTGETLNANHQFRFNWISDNVTARAGHPNIFDLNGGWVLVAQSNQPPISEVRTYAQASGNDIPADMPFKAAWIGTEAPDVEISWAIARSAETAQAFLDSHLSATIVQAKPQATPINELAVAIP